MGFLSQKFLDPEWPGSNWEKVGSLPKVNQKKWEKTLTQIDPKKTELNPDAKPKKQKKELDSDANLKNLLFK